MAQTFLLSLTTECFTSQFFFHLQAAFDIQGR
jgi:hypothetical protein